MHGVAGPMTVRVYHQQAQPNYIKNKCEFHNCHHICLPTALYSNFFFFYIISFLAEFDFSTHTLTRCGSEGRVFV